MPRKAVTNREEIIEGAFRLIRREGHDALTARRLAAVLGCSTQPIMYQFPNLAELRELAYRRADVFHTARILSGSDLLEVALNYIRFASEEAPLFRFLFQSGHFDGASIADMVRMPEAEGILRAISNEFGLNGEDAANVLETLFVTVHGYASLIANNAMEYDPDAVKNALVAVAEGLMKKGE